MNKSNRYSIVVVLMLIFSLKVLAQNLSLSDLQTICNKSNWEYVNQYLMNKGWEFYNSEKGSSTQYNTIIWSFNKSYNDKAQAWFHLYTYEGFPSKIYYTVFNKPAYLKIHNSLNSNGYKLINSEINDNEVISKYANNKYILEITTERREKENENYYYDENIIKSITAYNIKLIKKLGIYDPDNGAKTDYYDDGYSIRAEYTLKNGQLNGTFKSYYQNGKIKKSGNYINGKENGLFKEYNEDGSINIEYSMKDGELNGPFKIYYDNGNIKMTGSYINGFENGKFIVYNEDGTISKEYYMKNDERNGIYTGYYYDEGELFLKEIGNYTNDEKDGTWKTIILEEGDEITLEYENYINGIKNGLFQEVKGDSLIIGTYKNDMLNGEYKIYIDISRMFLGGMINTDISKLTLISEGWFSNDLETGYWKNYDMTGNIISEGTYFEGEKSGEWRYYYTNFGVEYPYSNELYCILNYSNDMLNGKFIRYSFFQEQQFPCSEMDSTKNSLDTCSRMVYQKVLETSFYKDGKLHGPYELRDSIGAVITKGSFRDGLMQGEWFHRYNVTDFERKLFVTIINSDCLFHDMTRIDISSKLSEDFIPNEDGLLQTQNYIFQKGNYIDNKRVGKWVQYYQEGQIVKTFNYKNGKLDGEYIVWNQFGKPSKKKKFENGEFKELIIYDSLGNNPIRKYEIYYDTYSYYKCRKTEYYEDSYTSQVYWMKKNGAISHLLFESQFESSIKNDLEEGYREGEFKLSSQNGKPLVIGNFYKDEKNGLWTNYYYDQNVKIVSNYKNGKLQDEKYHLLNGQLFSGYFTYINDKENVKEVRKIKNGLRNGNTVYINNLTGKTIKKEKYKDGVKK